MTVTSPPVSGPAHTAQADSALSSRQRQCLNEAALSLGADPAQALRFADTGAIAVDGLVAQVMPSADEDGAWLMTLQVPQPDGVPASVWADALLLANGQAMLAHAWAFGLEEDGDAVLLMPLPADLDDAALLAARLDGMLELGRAVSAGAVAAAGLASVEAGREGAAA